MDGYDYTHAIRCDPKHAEAYNARGLLFKTQGDAEKALKDYSAAIRANPAFAKAYLNRGSIYADKEQNVKAVEEFNAAINHHATFAEAYNARGMIRYREKEYDLAIRDFDQALLHESNLKTKAHFFSNRGFAKQMKNDTPGAIDDYNKAINADPSFWAAWHNRGLAYKEIGDDLRAAMDLSKARELKRLAAAAK
jgi:tetratricopeptide (TPR) repeat protein